MFCSIRLGIPSACSWTKRSRSLPPLTDSCRIVGGVVRRRVVVSGEVQGVFFRDTCRRVAYAEHVTGWVRNLPDGSVEAAFEGSPDAVARMVEWAKQGPRTALVDRVEEFDEEPENLTGFEIRPSTWRT